MSTASDLEHPKRAPEVELVGRMSEDAFDEECWLICYAGEHYIQATELLYQVLLHADGQTPVAEIARRIAADTGKDLSVDQVHWLITNRLAPSGLLTDTSTEQAGGEPHIATDAPLLGIRHRLPLLPYRLTAPITGILQRLYWPPLTAAVVIAVAILAVWIYRDGKVLESVRDVLFTPRLVLLLFGIEILTGLVHELGHASALRRANGRYGTIGFGLLVFWPVFYTDVTDAYRLNRMQRLRVDLGGIYFDFIMMLGLFLAYQITGMGVLLVAIVTLGWKVLDQFNPFFRFDGYYVIADIMAIPEPLSLVGPFLRAHIPMLRRRGRPLPPMRPFARVAFSLYLVAVAVYLLFPFILGGVGGAKLVDLVWESSQLYWHQFVMAWLYQGVIEKLATTLTFGMWLLVPFGLVRLAWHLLRQFKYLTQALVDRLRGAVVARSAHQAIQSGTVMDGMESDSESKPHDVQLESGVSPALLEQVIERENARQTAELRAAIEEIRQVYAAEVAAKEAQIAELSQRVGAIERERGRLDCPALPRADQPEAAPLDRPVRRRLTAAEVRRIRQQSEASPAA